MDRIFIQIASYRDKELLPTIKSAIKQAKYPERLTFGICYQDDIKTPYYEEVKATPNSRIIIIPPAESKGACFARSLTQSLWEKEEYTLQIDSHMQFEKNWDTRMMEMLSRCPSPKAYLTAYCADYVSDEGVLDEERHGQGWALSADYMNKYGIVLLSHGACIKGRKTPYPGAFMSGHFLFAPSKIIEEVPYDPQLYFHGEEISYAVRSWTAGWDIYHPSEVLCYHQYGRGDDKRVLHWSEHAEELFDMLSQIRVGRLLGAMPGNEDFGIYGLGNVRTLKEYEEFSGIDFASGLIKNKAFAGMYIDDYEGEFNCCIYDRVKWSREWGEEPGARTEKEATDELEEEDVKS